MITCIAAVQNSMLSRFPLPFDEELIGGPSVLVSWECLDPGGNRRQTTKSYRGVCSGSTR
jgi:hypothetical protein